jgi:hypothetical protein
MSDSSVKNTKSKITISMERPPAGRMTGSGDGEASDGVHHSARQDAAGDSVDLRTEEEALDALRREFLYDTARTLALSRVRAAQGLLKVVDDLGLSVSRLEKMQEAIGAIQDLHTSLKEAVSEELRRATGAIVRHNFGDESPDVLLPFSACVEKVVEMFMVDFPVDSK